MGSFVGIFFGSALLAFIFERLVTFAASGVSDTVTSVVRPVGVIGTWTGVTWLVGKRDVSKKAHGLREKNATAGSLLDSFIERVVKR